MGTKTTLLILLLAVTSCASSKNSHPAKELSSVKVKNSMIEGRTSKSDVIRLLGSPEMINMESNGKEQWVYSKSEHEWNDSYADFGVASLSLISDNLLGLSTDFGSSKTTSRSKMKTLEVYFTKSGILESYRFSTSKI